MDKMSKIILIAGPTSSGKSRFAVQLAKKINGEIINADSMQVYKQLKILTARPSKINQKSIKHHLYGFVHANKTFSTGQWIKLALKKIKEVQKRKKIPILVGGTGLYFTSLIDGLVAIPNIPLQIRNKIRLMQKKDGQRKFYNKLLKLDPKSKNKFDPNDIQRSIRAFEIKKYTKISMYDWFNKTKPKFNEKNFIKIYINYPREVLISRINLRVDQMIKDGAIKEVKRFQKLKIKPERSANKVIGITEIKMFLQNQLDLEKVKEMISIRTRQYAKRQTTWSRGKMESWTKIDPKNLNEVIKKINKSSLKLDQLI